MKIEHLAFAGVIAVILALYVVDYFTQDGIAEAGRTTFLIREIRQANLGLMA